MEEKPWERIRHMLVDVHTIDDEGLYFDSDVALIKGYSPAEIKIAEDLLQTTPSRTIRGEQLLEEILWWTHCKQFDATVYYIEAVKLLCVINTFEDTYTYIFEEDLDIEIANSRYLDKYIWYQIDNT